MCKDFVISYLNYINLHVFLFLGHNAFTFSRATLS